MGKIEVIIIIELCILCPHTNIICMHLRKRRPRARTHTTNRRQELIDAKMAELADTHERNAQTKHDVIDTKALENKL